jgi:alkylation response protein AidB-like acyl-CoA dehydrogenase
MDFDFTDDQTQLQDAVRRYLDKASSFEQRRRIVKAGGFSRESHQGLADLGLSGLCLSAEHGGMDMGAVECMLVMNEMGRAIALEPLSHTWMCGLVIQNSGNAALQVQWLPALASGQALMSLAHVEQGGRYRLAHCTTTAQAQGDAYTLTGSKRVVPAGDCADALLVPAMLDGQIALFILERGSPGLHTSGYLTQDGSRAADVRFDQAKAQLLTKDGADALDLMQDIASACACAYGVGAMEKLLALTVEYMNTRKQFGVPIASFQALRHRVADMKMQLELTRSMSYLATLRLGANATDRRKACSQAKYQLSQSARYVGQQAMQLHGGIGITDEYIGSHYFKALTQIELTFGDGLHHLDQASHLMGETAGVFA